jgi:glycosyltransferase involved in cell wall biosynthesis
MFSVIVPVFDRDPTPALKSVQAQTLRDWECIVVDDGSRNGPDIEAAVEALADNRFRYIRQSNMGANAARNRGIDEARQPFVAFLDSDDSWLPKKLEIQSHQVVHGGCVAFCQFYADRGVGKRWVRPTKFPRGDVAKYLFIKNQFIQTSTIALSTQIAKLVRWDENLKRGQDLDFALRLRAIGCYFDFMPEPLVVVDDRSEADRVSRASGIENHLAFLASHKISWRARLGYRATYLAYELAATHPFMAAKDLALGLVAGVSPLVIARQTIRAFLPRSIYRNLVNSFVAVVGR